VYVHARTHAQGRDSTPATGTAAKSKASASKHKDVMRSVGSTFGSQDEGVFEIIDYTLASPWEKYIPTSLSFAALRPRGVLRLNSR
jgi:hypothetical protein